MRRRAAVRRRAAGRMSGHAWMLGLGAVMTVRTSAALVTSLAPPRMSAWHPADCAEVTGPGTAISGLPRSLAWRAVFMMPPRAPASMMTVPALSAAMRRVRCSSRSRVGLRPDR